MNAAYLKMIVATDGSANLQLGVAASGIYFQQQQAGLKQSYTIRVPPNEIVGNFQVSDKYCQPTNNRGELLAIIHAIRLISRTPFAGHAIILTDSQYSIYVDGWIRNGARLHDRPNEDLALQYKAAVEGARFTFELKKVKAHLTAAQFAKLSKPDQEYSRLNSLADGYADYRKIGRTSNTSYTPV